MRITIIGAGELGGRVARRISADVRAITATPARHPALHAAGVQPSTEWPRLSAADRVLLALPGSPRQLEAIERLASQPRPARAVLISTIGFHGPYSGTIRAADPPGSSKRAHLAATTEAAFRRWAGPNGSILRCAGLWHRDRGPQRAFTRSRTARLGPPDAPLPLIHYEDAATLATAALVDDVIHPVLLGVVSAPTRSDFYTACARAIGAPVPLFTAPTGLQVGFEDPVASQLLGSPAYPDWRAMLHTD